MPWRSSIRGSRGCGAKREVAVAVRVPGRRRQLISKQKTFYQVLQRPVAWLVEQGVTHVAMEATGVYWKPVFHALCEAQQIEVLLVNARQGQQGDQGPCPAGSAPALRYLSTTPPLTVGERTTPPPCRGAHEAAVAAPDRCP